MEMILQFDKLNLKREGSNRKFSYFIDNVSIFFESFVLQVGNRSHFHLGFIPNFIVESNQVSFHSLVRKAQSN